MAHNPFSWFRRHQKAVFAFMILVSMFSFILVWGQGDAMSWVARGFSSRQAGERVATLNGQKVYEGNLRQLAARRRLASDFLFTNAWVSRPKAVDDLLKHELKIETGADNPMASVRMLAEEAGGRDKQESPTYLRWALADAARQGFDSPDFLRKSRELDTQIQENLNFLARVASSDKVREQPSNLQVIDALVTVNAFQRWFIAHFRDIQFPDRAGLPVVNNSFYFGGTRKPDDLLDFVLWQQQADRLGVTLTEADVVREVNREAAGQKVIGNTSFLQDAAVASFLRQKQNSGTEPSELLAALREEFRVAMAQGILLGREPGVRSFRVTLDSEATPAQGTPDEFLRFYRDQQTTLRVSLLRLPVSQYVGEVKGEPTEAELVNRYEAYRDKEFDPRQRDPGFREPHRVAVQYLSASPKAEYFRDQARQQTQVIDRVTDPTEALRHQITFPAGLGHLGAGPGGWAGPLALVFRLDPLARAFDEQVVQRSGFFRSASEGARADEERVSRLHESSYAQPDVAAAVFGSLTAATLGVGGAAAAPASLYGPATLSEVRGSLRYNSALLLGWANAGAGLDPVGQALRTAALTAPYHAEIPPLERFRERLLAGLEEPLPAEMVEETLSTIGREMAAAKAKAGALPEAQKKAIDRLLAETLERHVLVKGKNRQPALELVETGPARSQREFTEALEANAVPALKPVAEAYRETVTMMFPTQGVDATPKGFVAALFGRPAFFGTTLFQPVLPVKTAVPPVSYLAWRNQDVPARTPSFDEVRSRVADAWRFEKARELARQKAGQVRDAVLAGGGSAADAVRLLREQKVGEVFELDRVSRLVSPDREVHALMSPDYRPYQIPESARSLLPYPRADFVEDLQTLRKPGDALVIPDEPVRNFYVAVLMDRDQKSVADFVGLYARTAINDPLYARFLEDQDRRFRTRVLAQLRRDALGDAAEEANSGRRAGAFPIPDAVRKRLEGSREDLE